MLGGAKWTSLSALIITIIQIAQFAFLGNVMSLKEFGLVGMITTVTIFTQILLDLGIGAKNHSKGTNDRTSIIYIILDQPAHRDYLVLSAHPVKPNDSRFL